MSMGQAVSNVFKKYAVFSGRARRSEYWFFFLFNFIVSFLLYTLFFFFGDSLIIAAVVCIWTLFVMIPTYAVTCRRLHDSGHSGGWVFFPFVVSILGAIQGFFSISLINDPLITLIITIMVIIMGIIIFVFLVTPGNSGSNEFGEDPKEELSNSDQAIPVDETQISEIDNRNSEFTHTDVKDEIKFCRECGKPLTAGSVYCSFCGKKIL